LNFNIVGDIYGGLWSLENNESQAFLWEKYTTHPFVEQKKCRYIGEVVTPWPCFVIAVRNDVYEQHKDALSKMCSIVNEKAQVLKQNENAIDIIAWRYNLRRGQVENWLNETDWNYSGISYPLALEKTVSFLKKLNLITEKESESWREKLL